MIPPEIKPDRRRAMNGRHRAGMLPAFVIAICLIATTIAAKVALAADEPSTGATKRGMTVQTLQLVRAGQLEEALAELGRAVDMAATGPPEQVQGLPAAAGGIARALEKRDPVERYELLYAWTMPSGDRPHLRMLATPVPRSLPPRDFARVLGERPSDDAFRLASVGEIDGLFSTGWMLARAAEETGRLSRLAAELQEHVSRGVPGADVLLLLARLADRRIDTDALAAQLSDMAAEAAADAPSDDTRWRNASAAVALAAAATTHQPLRPTSESLLQALIDAEQGLPSPDLLGFLRRTHAIVVQLNRGESNPEVLQRNRLRYWVPATNETAAESAEGSTDAMWLVHEDHILHLSGARNDALLCRFPLVGQFEVTCETQTGGAMRTDGGLVYGGLQYEALANPEQMTVWDADLLNAVTKPCPFLRQDDGPTFNRLSIRVSSDAAAFLANLHPMWIDQGAFAGSPWIGLRSFGSNRPMFRNLQISGDPTIPRQIDLTAGNQLRGWQSAFFAETRASVGDAESNAPLDWMLNDGVITAGVQSEDDKGNQSLLRYQRPLLEGETVRYEYFYEAGAHEVHPALGRVAFLIEPTGVRIHWITDGELEWTGLPDDNATLEPFNRRGGRSLPLVENDWNAVQITRREDAVTLSLNGTLIYQRPDDSGAPQPFGLFRNPSTSAVKVRSVTLSGDWPQQLPEPFVDNPVATVDAEEPAADSRVSSTLVGERFLAENVRHIRRRAARMPTQRRYEFLANWILPSATQTAFRLGGRFTSTDPIAENFPEELRDAGFAPEFPSDGARLVSPLYDLLLTSEDLGNLDDLRARVEQTADLPEPQQRRAKDAILALIALQQNDMKKAGDICLRLQTAVTEMESVEANDIWPETLVVYWGVHHFPGNEAVGELLMALYQQRAQRLMPPSIEWWHTQIASLKSRYEHQLVGGTDAAFDAEAGLEQWIPVVRERAKSRGNGAAPVRWHRDADDQVLHLAGHQEEYLFYRSPMRGDYEVEADITAWGTAQFLSAGTFVGPKGNRDSIETGTFRRGVTQSRSIPQLSNFDRWLRLRAVFRDSVCSIFLNGRQVHEIPLDSQSDPWIGFRSWWRNIAGFRDVRITGHPIVPARVSLSEKETLDEWVTYHDESSSQSGSEWRLSPQPEGTEIVADRAAELDGSFLENLLRWQRPLLEDGSIAYEFYYAPGGVLAHPALDRLAFLVGPEGVRLHWITDGKHDATGVRPDNIGPVENFSDSDWLLVPDAWNHLRLSLSGDTVSIDINGVMVYRHQLDPTNKRSFGLFHFADQTEARVRRVVLTGDWPRQIPPVAEQDLADDVAKALDADLPRLRSVFHHEFADSSRPERYFRVWADSNPQGVVVQRDGLLTRVASRGEWTQVTVVPNFTLDGDFDIEARFDQAELVSQTGENAFWIVAHFKDPEQHQARTARAVIPGGRNILKGQLSIQHPDGTRRYIDQRISDESTSGVIRVARRGSTVYSLFAQGDSGQFRVVGENPVSDAEIESVRLAAAASGGGHAKAVWKTLTLRAERMTLPPPEDEPPVRELVVMDVDGSGLRAVARPRGGMTHLGSPEWSADGRTIGFDMSSGSISTSRIMVVSADGSALKDLGAGCMPSFSPDATRIAFSQPGAGVMVMDADGSRRRTVDRSGWGVQWSPAGNTIAYAKSGNITIKDMMTGRERQVLRGNDVTRYSSIYWNLCWSRDGRFIAFKGLNRETRASEIGIADTSQGGKLTIGYSTTGSLNASFTWAPNDQDVLFTMHSAAHGVPKLFRVSRLGEEPPELFEPQPENRKILDCAWSPDGRTLALSTEIIPEPVEWPLAKESR